MTDLAMNVYLSMKAVIEYPPGIDSIEISRSIDQFELKVTASSDSVEGAHSALLAARQMLAAAILSETP